jgi:hypothetical protein
MHTHMKGATLMLRSLFTYAGSGFLGRAARRAAARAATLAAITVLALGTLSGTAEAQPIYTDLTTDLYMQSVPWVGGGDADVYTKSGRYTNVFLSAGLAAVSPDGLSAYFSVTYAVQELAPNHTRLQRSDLVSVYAPPGYRIVRVLNTYSGDPGGFFGSYYGQDHNAHDESAAVAGTYFRSLVVRFDGPGRDDQGNAAMVARLAVPVELAPR